MTACNPIVVEIVVWGLSLELRLFGLFAFLVGLGIYPFYISAMRQGRTRPPRSSWFLWVILDAVAFGSKLNKGNFDAMLFAFTMGTIVTALFTIKYGKKEWTFVETICTVIVFLSIVIWAIVGPSAATICSLAGMIVAAFPIYERVFQGEYESLAAWFIAFASTILNLIDGQVLVGIWFIVLELGVILPVLYHWKLVPKKRKD